MAPLMSILSKQSRLASSKSLIQVASIVRADRSASVSGVAVLLVKRMGFPCFKVCCQFGNAGPGGFVDIGGAIISAHVCSFKEPEFENFRPPKKMRLTWAPGAPSVHNGPLCDVATAEK